MQLPWTRVSRISAIFRFALVAFVLIYASIAGLRTIVDFDLGWQIADARHPWSSVDTLSYTVPEATWIYPPLAGLLFRGLFAVGGYPAISLFCAGALLVTVAVIAARCQPIVLELLLFAMPAFAQQMIPRSGLFTIVFAAITARILLDYKSGSRRNSLWMLALVLAFWVNLHPGFIAGLALMLGYILSEVVDLLCYGEYEVRPRLRNALPWIGAAFLATLINPWGWRMYAAVARQEHPTAIQSTIIRELYPLYRDFSLGSLNPLEPTNAIWWILALSILAVPFLIFQKRAGTALLLLFAIIACLLSARSEGVFLSLACLIVGDAFATATKNMFSRGQAHRWRSLSWATVLAALVFVTIRCVDIVTNRLSVREDQITSFGSGPSWWIPERAADFIEEHSLPTQLFTSFNLGSYVTNRLGSHYRDFADGRYIPFGDQLVSEQLRLSSLPLDSSAWSEATTKWNIRTIILPLARFYAIQSVPLRENCSSHNWTPVYLDTTAVVFVRNDALSPNELAALRIDCQKQPLISSAKGSSIERYQQFADAAVILFVLGRNQEAQEAMTSAKALFSKDDSLMLLAGELQASSNNLSSAEQSFHNALALHESDAGRYQLGLTSAREGKYTEAIEDFRRALSMERPPGLPTEISLARAELFTGQADAALRTVDETSRLLRDTPDQVATSAELADLEAAAWIKLSNLPAAIAAERRAVEETPDAVQRWQALAALYSTAGQSGEAEKARQRARFLVGQSR